jgi:hypothetical protein
MLQFLRGFLNADKAKPVAATPRTPVVQMPAYTAADAGADTASQEFSLTDAASQVLGAQLSKQTVIRHGFKGEEPASFPVAGVTLKSSGSHPSHMMSLSGENNDIVKGDSVTLAVKLNRPATDYTLESLNKALHAVLSGVPALAGKIEAPAVVKPQNLADVWQELKPLLAAHPKAFSEKERAMIAAYFEANKGTDANARSWGETIDASHNEGKVTIRIEAHEMPQDKNAVVSSDAALVEYFNQHHDQLLAKVKEKAVALGVVTAEDLAQLNMHIEATGWNIQADFGTKPASDIDPVTQQKLTPVELAKKMTETPLAKIDTKKLGAIFTQALLESSHELPPMLPRILDGHLLAGILKQRLAHEPKVEALIVGHDMFKNREEVQAAETARANSGKIKLEAAYASETSTGQSELSLSFDLPAGMNMTQLLDSITGAKAQRTVEMHTTSMAHAVRA